MINDPTEVLFGALCPGRPGCGLGSIVTFITGWARREGSEEKTRMEDGRWRMNEGRERGSGVKLGGGKIVFCVGCRIWLHLVALAFKGRGVGSGFGLRRRAGDVAPCGALWRRVARGEGSGLPMGRLGSICGGAREQD